MHLEYLSWGRRLLHTQSQTTDTKRPKLQFNHDGTFQITVFSDLHYAEGT